MWGGAQWHVMQVEGVELIRCVNGCVISLGTGLAGSITSAHAQPR